MIPYPMTFLITKRSAKRYGTYLCPSGSAPRGTAYIENTSSAGAVTAADGTLPIAGFVTRAIVSGGPTLADTVFPNHINQPFGAPAVPAAGEPGLLPNAGDGSMITLEFADEFEAEGADYIYSGSAGNAAKTLNENTALKTAVSFYAGKACVAVSGQWVDYLLLEVKDAVDSDNAARFRFVKCEAFLKP